MTPQIAKVIRTIYRRRLLTQRQIAAMMGLSQGSVSRIVSGQTWAR